MQGVWYDHRPTGKLRDEAPAAYKDIRAVLEAQRELMDDVRFVSHFRFEFRLGGWYKQEERVL
jgi:hypothetical protein